MSATAEICSVSGILKVCEILFGFITVIIHRYGDYGKMIFFGTSAVQLSPVSHAVMYMCKSAIAARTSIRNQLRRLIQFSIILE